MEYNTEWWGPVEYIITAGMHADSCKQLALVHYMYMQLEDSIPAKLSHTNATFINLKLQLVADN